jgi:segregation and condensation protein B
MRRLEAVLFLARESLSSRKLSQYANLADGTEARTLIRRLNEMYEQSQRAFRVEEIAGGYRLMTRPQFGAWVKRLAHVPAEVRLSAPALETLAVVVYRQPVLKATVEAIRGVNSGEVLRQLMERDLVRIVGRSEELGRPYLYASTARFLEVFGLRSLDELPRVEGLRPAAAAALENKQHREEHDVTVNYPSAHSKEEIETVTTQHHRHERLAQGRRMADGGVPVAAEEDDFEEEDDFGDEEDDEVEDDEDLDEEFDEEDLEEEEWEYEEEEDGEFEDDLEDDEWEEVEGEDDEDLEEDEEWDDEEEEEDEDWEDD